jgi:hypothetical protein
MYAGYRLKYYHFRKRYAPNHPFLENSCLLGVGHLQWSRKNILRSSQFFLMTRPHVQWLIPVNLEHWWYSLSLSECLLCRVRIMVLNATFNNISVISWQSVLVVEETGIPGENHWPVVSHWQTLSHKVVLSIPHHEWDSNSQH